MPKFRQIERTLSEVTTITEVEANDAAHADFLFGGGEGEVVEQTLGKVERVIDSKIEVADPLVDDDPDYDDQGNLKAGVDHE